MSKRINQILSFIAITRLLKMMYKKNRCNCKCCDVMQNICKYYSKLLMLFFSGQLVDNKWWRGQRFIAQDYTVKFSVLFCGFSVRLGFLEEIQYTT